MDLAPYTVIPSNTSLIRPRSVRVSGRVIYAWKTAPRHMPTSRYTNAQKNGRRYEKKIGTRLLSALPSIELSPWFEFDSSLGLGRLCQPDAILVGEKELTIFEIKYSHCLEAFWQLSDLYYPVLSSFVDHPNIRLVEIVRSFDPSIQFPIPINLHLDLDSILSMPFASDRIHVLPWK